MYLLDYNFLADPAATKVLLGVGFSIIVYFLKKYMSSNDKRMDEIEEEAQEIRKNYNLKFDRVYQKIDEGSDRTNRKVEDSTNLMLGRLEELQRDKQRWRETTNRELGVMSEAIKHLTHSINDKKRGE